MEVLVEIDPTDLPIRRQRLDASSDEVVTRFEPCNYEDSESEFNFKKYLFSDWHKYNQSFTWAEFIRLEDCETKSIGFDL